MTDRSAAEAMREAAAKVASDYERDVDEYHRKHIAPLRFVSEEQIAEMIDAQERGEKIASLRIAKSIRDIPLPEATPDPRDAALARALDLLRAYEAWEADLILTGNWSDLYVRMKEHHHYKMLKLQHYRNEAIAAINEATKGSSDAPEV
jgi:predicted nucleic acid-binding protein